MDLLDDQDGVVGRHQLLAAGWTPNDIRRSVRRRDLSPIHRGVYLRQTGEPTWLQRAWAALVAVSTDAELADVALSHQSALRIVDGPGRRAAEDSTIHVAVGHHRRLQHPEGVVVHRGEHFDGRRRARPTTAAHPLRGGGPRCRGGELGDGLGGTPRPRGR